MMFAVQLLHRYELKNNSVQYQYVLTPDLEVLNETGRDNVDTTWEKGFDDTHESRRTYSH